MASALHSGVEGLDPEVRFLAGFGFLLASLAWAREHRRGSRWIARALDRRLRFAGALYTAYEIEERAVAREAMGELEELVLGRVLARLRPAEAIRAMFPPLFLPIAAPVLSAGFLVLTLEERRPGEAFDVDVAGLSSEMVSAVGALGADALNAREEGSLAPRDAEELLEVWNRMKGMDRRLAEGRRIDELERGALLSDLEGVEASLARLVGRMDEDPELRSRLETARNVLEAIRSGLALKGGSTADSEADPGSRGVPPGVDSRTPNALASTGSGEEGTIPGSSSPTGVPNEPPAGDDPPVSRPSELVGAGRFWPASYDRLVTAWVQARERVLEETGD